MMDYKQNLRKWTSLGCGIVAYFLVHEGTHLLYAVSIGAFKQINIIGFGIQIEPYAERMSVLQRGVFNLLGPASAIVCGYILLAFASRFVMLKSAYARAIAFYTTIAFLIIDPLYLCFLSFFVGGGDMNGIILILPEAAVRVVAGLISLINTFIIISMLVPKYRLAFQRYG
jgi:hypothetical protein